YRPARRRRGVVLQQHAQRAAAVLAGGALAGGGGRRGDPGGAAGVRGTGVEVPDAALEAVEDPRGAAGGRVQARVVARPVPVDARVGVGLAAEVLVALDLDAGGQDV